MNTRPAQTENSFSISLCVFYLMLLYLPYESYLPSTAMGMGINLLNIFLVILLFATMTANTPFHSAGYGGFKLLIFIFMTFTFASSLMNGSQLGIGDAIITWKRFYFIPVLFIIAFNLLQTERQIKTTMVIVSIVTLTSAVQVLRNNTGFSSAHFNDGLRYGGMFGPGGENDLAAFLAINFFWFLFWSQEATVRWKRLLILGMTAIVGWACLYCYSRGAYIALTAGLVYYGWKRYRMVLVVLVVMLFTIPVWAPQPVRERVEMLTQDDKLEKDESAQRRLVIWEGGKQMIAANLLFGVGPNNFSNHIRNYAVLPEKSPTVSHNMYLRMAAELGIPGLILFLLILGSFFKVGLRLSKETDGWQSTWATAFTASIIAVVIVNYFGDRFLREELTGYIWLGAAIACKLRGMQAYRKSMEIPAESAIPVPNSAIRC